MWQKKRLFVVRQKKFTNIVNLLDAFCNIENGTKYDTDFFYHKNKSQRGIFGLQSQNATSFIFSSTKFKILCTHKKVQNIVKKHWLSKFYIYIYIWITFELQNKRRLKLSQGSSNQSAG